MSIDLLLEKKASLSVIGLGYVGLPLAYEFAKIIQVIGFDINQKKIQLLKEGKIPNKDLEKFIDLNNLNITFTSNKNDLKNAIIHIIAVPTPVDKHNNPDLSLLAKACEIVGSVLKKGDIVIIESTIYPGCTEEFCVPILESFSNLKFTKDFKIGYSPERINPGDTEHTLPNIIKVVSACDEETLNIIANLYSLIVKKGVFKASSIKVAEAAKIIENIQRDINIALINELSIIFNKLGISTYDVLEAAFTKWNFLRFYPGLVGGHCIGVDPYYLLYKAKELKYYPQIITAGRFVNDNMGHYIAEQTLRKLIAINKNILNSKVLIFGITFKENISDIRNSKVFDIYNELISYGIKVDVLDNHANKEEVKEEYNIDLIDSPNGKYDAIIIAVAHNEFKNFTKEYLEGLLQDNGLIVDIKGIYRKIKFNCVYWSL